MKTRRIPLALLVVAHLASAYQDNTTIPTPTFIPSTYSPPDTPSPSPNPTLISSTSSTPAPYTPGSDWSLSAEQLDLVNRRIRSTEVERQRSQQQRYERYEESLSTTLPPVDQETTTLPPADYEEKLEEPEEPSSVSGDHLPLGRHDQKKPDVWSASQEVLDASFPARRRRQVVMRSRRQIPIPPVATARPIQPLTQKPSKINVGKGQGEYHGTVLGAVFIKPKQKTTIAPVAPFINLP